MPTAAMAHEILVAAAVPNLSATQPQLKKGNSNLADTPPAPGTITVPQAPSGSVTNQAATYNFNNTITSTKKYTQALVAAAENATVFNFTSAVTPGVAPLGSSVGLKEDIQTTPSAPTGTFSLSGTAAISNAAAVVLAGLPQAQQAFFKFQ